MLELGASGFIGLIFYQIGELGSSNRFNSRIGTSTISWGTIVTVNERPCYSFRFSLTPEMYLRDFGANSRGFINTVGRAGGTHDKGRSPKIRDFAISQPADLRLELEKLANSAMLLTIRLRVIPSIEYSEAIPLCRRSTLQEYLPFQRSRQRCHRRSQPSYLHHHRIRWQQSPPF